MNRRGKLDWWAEVLPALLLISACCGCAGGAHHSKLPWHHKKAACDVVWEFPFYGHYPTCWRPWPADWIGCPPICPEPVGGQAVESHAELVPPPAVPEGATDAAQQPTNERSTDFPPPT
jgi:hypothetical protein